MFLVNSCLGLFTAGHLSDLPLFRSYGVILPSSLTIVLSLTLGYSPCPPVSVLGTGTYIISPRNFSRKLGVIKLLLTFVSSHSRFRFIQLTHFTINHPLRLNLNPIIGSCYPSPSLHQSYRWYRNINLLSIDYAFRPRLRTRLTLGRRT